MVRKSQSKRQGEGRDNVRISNILMDNNML